MRLMGLSNGGNGSLPFFGCTSRIDIEGHPTRAAHPSSLDSEHPAAPNVAPKAPPPARKQPFCWVASF